MLEILQFIFSSFWIWLGVVIMLSIPFNSIVKLFKKKNKKSNI